jgi:hypothetical protein
MSKYPVFKRWSVVALVGVMSFIGPSCGDDEIIHKDAMVTIAGMVVNVDTGDPQPGMRVTLLGTSFSDDVATGTDGAYELRVPRGSKLVFVADDFSKSQDDFIPLINVDLPPVVANTDMLNFLVHCCPRTQCGPDTWGSIAFFDEYLQNGDQDNGDMFVPTSTAAAGGAIGVFYNSCTNAVENPLDGLSFTTNTTEFPICYIIGDSLLQGPLLNEYAKCSATPDIAYPASHAATDWGGVAFSWGDPAFTGNTVELSITDTKNALPFRSPFDVPVRPGALTLLWVSAVDGVPNRPMMEVFTCLGWL